jgi:hypothetical protein
MEFYLAKDHKTVDAAHNLGQNCADMGMDVSGLVFYHGDLGPVSSLVESDTRRIRHYFVTRRLRVMPRGNGENEVLPVFGGWASPCEEWDAKSGW